MTNKEFGENVITVRLWLKEAEKSNYVEFFNEITEQKVQAKKEEIIKKFEQMQKLYDEICEALGW